MGITRQHHTAVTVSDMEASLRFYTRLLGFILDEVSVLDEERVFKVFGVVGAGARCAAVYSPQGQRLELYEFSSGQSAAPRTTPDKPGFGHLGFAVDHLDEIGRALELEGVEFIAPPYSSPTGDRVAMLRDPDGVAIQLVEKRSWTTRLSWIVTPVRMALTRSRRRRAQALVGTAFTKSPTPNGH